MKFILSHALAYIFYDQPRIKISTINSTFGEWLCIAAFCLLIWQQLALSPSLHQNVKGNGSTRSSYFMWVPKLKCFIKNQDTWPPGNPFCALHFLQNCYKISSKVYDVWVNKKFDDLIRGKMYPWIDSKTHNFSKEKCSNVMSVLFALELDFVLNKKILESARMSFRPWCIQWNFDQSSWKASLGI